MVQKAFRLSSKLIAKYKETHGIAAYLQIRKKFPEIEIQVPQMLDEEFVFAWHAELEGMQIPPRLVFNIIHPNEPSVDALCLRLLELLAARDALPRSGPGHINKRRAAISDTMLNYLISMILEGYDWRDTALRIPASLVVLIRRQLCGPHPKLYYAHRARTYRRFVAMVIGEDFAPGERVSARKLANRYMIPRSTAARWVAEPEFCRELTAVSRIRHSINLWNESFNRRKNRPAGKNVRDACNPVRRPPSQIDVGGSSHEKANSSKGPKRHPQAGGKAGVPGGGGAPVHG